MKRWIWFLIFIAIACVSFLFVEPRDVSALAMRFGSHTAMYATVSSLIFALFYAILFGFTIPITTLFMMLSGALFGFPAGFLVIVVGTVVGSLSVFYYSRVRGEVFARAFLGDKTSVVIEEARRHPISFLLSTRFAPLIPFPVAHVVPALAGIRARDFLWTTFVGTIPHSLGFVLVGEALMYTTMGETYPTHLVALGLAGLSVAVLVPLWWRRRNAAHKL